MLDIDVIEFPHLERDAMSLSIQGVIHLFASYQSFEHAHVFGEFLEPHRWLAHHPHRRVPGTDAYKGAAGGEPVDGGDTIGCNRSESQSRNRATGTHLY